MPEGDIVLRVARRLDQALAGQRLIRGELRWPDLGGQDLAGRVVLGHGTYGKHLLTRFDDGRTLRTHLQMDGTWRVVRSGAPDARTAPGSGGDPRRRPAGGAGTSPRISAVLATRRWTVLGIDLGMMDLIRTAEERHLLAHLGPDLLAPEADLAVAARRLLAQGPRPVAESLLDQRVVAGLGTIYTAESLWTHRIWPWTASAALGERAEALLRTARCLMLRSAEARTPTATGDPRRTANVHDRARRPCPRCGTPITRAETRPGAGRTARPIFLCPACQVPETPATPEEPDRVARPARSTRKDSST